MQNIYNGQEGGESELAKMVKENLELNREIYKVVKGLKRHIFLQSVFGVFKVFLIIVPLVLGYFYFSPYLEKMLEQYNDLLGIKAGIAESGLDQIDLKSLNFLK